MRPIRFDRLFEAIINETYDSAAEDYWELHSEIAHSLIAEFLNNPDGKQPWEVLPADKIIHIWKYYMKYDRVPHDSDIDNLAYDMVRNVAKLEINTELAGHTQVSSAEVWELAGFEDHLTEELDEKFGDYILRPDGHWRISDYGLKPLVTFAISLLDAKSPEEKVRLMDRMFQVAHQRGDLAANFIEGGASTLDMLFDEDKRPYNTVTK